MESTMDFRVAHLPDYQKDPDCVWCDFIGWNPTQLYSGIMS